MRVQKPIAPYCCNAAMLQMVNTQQVSVRVRQPLNESFRAAVRLFP